MKNAARILQIVFLYANSLLTFSAFRANILSKGGATMPKNEETKRERFVRLAENRTNKILNMVQLLGNCSNSSLYEYTDADVEIIFGAIESSVKEARRKFAKNDSVKNTRFTLD